MLLGFRAAARQADRLYLALGYLCGLELFLLALFITYQVVARRLEWPRAPGTDVMSGYVLAMAASWALAYALRSGAHVRIDALLPHMGKRLRAAADWVALLAVAFFASVTAWKMWDNVLGDYRNGVVSTADPVVPLFVPKAVVAVGFTLLVAAAAQMMLAMVAETWLPRLHEAMGGEEIERAPAGPAAEAP